MARPKGSTNKPKTEEKPVEFDYETEADKAYANAMSPSVSHTPSLHTNRAEFDYAEDEGAPVQQQTQVSSSVLDVSLNLFIVNGRVRLDRSGQDPVVADQQRLVYAHNFNEAAMKYNSYFVSMSNGAERYSVISIGGSEAIR